MSKVGGTIGWIYKSRQPIHNVYTFKEPIRKEGVTLSKIYIMKKYIIALSCLFLIHLPMVSQVISIKNMDGKKNVNVAEKKMVVDTCILRVQYRISYVKDVKMPEKKRNYSTLLQIGRRISKFSDYFGLKADSLDEEFAKQKMDEIEVANKLLPILTGTSPTNVFKNYPKNKITVTDIVPMSGNFKYVEEKTKPVWKMEQGDSTICGYSCQKATTTFRGRNYTVWYTSKIPYSDGPWKFWGLPGLILKVTDDKNEYSFECVAIEKPGRIESIYIKDKDYFNTTREKFNAAQKNFYDNPGPMFENRGVKVDGKPIGNKSRPYNPIELSE